MAGFFGLMVLVLFALVVFGIYFMFKALEFVVRAVSLYEAIIGREDRIIELLSRIEARGRGAQGTPQAYATLHDAVTSADGEAIARMLDSGVNIDAVAPTKTGQKMTPLDLAVARGDLEMVMLLVSRGATVAGGGGSTESHAEYAEKLGHPAVAQFLKDAAQGK